MSIERTPANSPSGPGVVTKALSGRIVAVWGILILATLLSWCLGADHGIANHRIATALVMIVAFIKVRIVGFYFMELRDAPIQLRAMYDGYCVMAGSAILGLYFVL